MTFEFTEYNYPDSSLVNAVVYNENEKVAVVSLNDEAYRYNGVSKSDYEALINASSVGAHYNTKFKRDFGPSDYVGRFWDLGFSEVEVKAPEPATGPSLSFPSHVYAHTTVGTPKGLTYAENAKVDEVAQVFDLSSEPKTLEAKTRHKITFDVVGGAKKRKYNIEASSVDDAVEQIDNIADILGLEFVIRKVTVYFE